MGLLDAHGRKTPNPKAKLVQRLKREKNLHRTEVVFVDDDQAELLQCKPFCHLLFVKERDGMTNADLSALASITTPDLKSTIDTMGIGPLLKEDASADFDGFAVIANILGMD